MNIKIQLNHPKAEFPKKANEYDCGFDLKAVSVIQTEKYVEYDTGVSIEIPEGYGGFLFPRSSISNFNLHLANSVGVIDPGYVGNLKFRFKTVNSGSLYEIGDRIGQLVIIALPKITLEIGEVNGNRQGFGSSGK